MAFVGLASVTANALSLGAERVESYLGQPLRVSYPIISSTNESFDEQCFKFAVANRNDGIAPLLQASLSVDANRRQLTLRGRGSADEPALRFAIDVGCDVPLRREYVVLLDPAPAVAPPQFAAAEPAVSSGPPVSASAVGTEASKPQPAIPASGGQPTATSGVGRGAVAPPTARAVSGAKASTEPRRSQPAQTTARKKNATDRLTVGSGAGPNGTSIDDGALAALAVPRLRISRDIPAFYTDIPQSGSTNADELSAAIAKERRARLLAAPIDEDIAPRLEADLVVAKRRLAEAQAQLSASPSAGSGTTTAASSGSPAKAAVPATAPAANGSSAFDGWWILGLLALLLGLLASLWLWLRQRNSKRASDLQQNSASGSAASLSNAFDAGDEDTPADTLAYSDATERNAAPSTVSYAPRSAAQSEKAAAEQLASPLFQLSDTEASVDVSELSQVTDEAQVFVDLGLNDQAIAVLKDHIANQSTERPSPAVWLMLFDLLRRADRRADYDALAPQFRSRFNGRMPEWESYSTELALDDGLEAFPHLVARIASDWGSPEVRKFLEEMLYDNRGGSRLGFSLAAYRDLMLLLQIHDDLAAQNQLAGKSTKESRGADDEDGTPKWDLSLELLEPPKPGELEAFLRTK